MSTGLKVGSHVTVIGAGIVGASTAYHLIEKGYNVTILDAAGLVGGTGLKSSAIMFLGPLIEKKDKSNTGLIQWMGYKSYDMLQNMDRNWGDSINFEKRPTMGLIANKDELEFAKTRIAVGNVAKILTIDEALKIEPNINPQLLGAVYHSNGATVDPYLTVRAYIQRCTEIAKHRNVEFNLRMKHKIIGLKRVSPNKIIIDCANGTQLTTSNIVVCTGWKVNQHCKWLNYSIPVSPVHGQMWAADAKGIKLNCNLYGLEALTYWLKNDSKLGGHRCTVDMRNCENSDGTIDDSKAVRMTRHFYGLQSPNNGMIKFGGDRMTQYLGRIYKKGIRVNHDYTSELLPIVKQRNCEIKAMWYGTMPFTPDQKPILGRLENGIYVCTGVGFMRGSAAGLLLAEVIYGKNVSNYPFLNECKPYRFDIKPKSKL